MSVCNVYRLQAFVDGQLGDSEARQITAHVATCAACAHLLSELQAVSAPLRGVAESAPAGLHERLLNAVAGLQPLAALQCEGALELASARLDGELAHEDCQRLQAHLDGCCVCARAAAEMELTGALLHSLDDEAAPAGLLQQIQAAAELAAAPAPKPVQWRRWTTSIAGMAAAAALLVALLTNSPQAPTVVPMVAQTPRIERAIPAPVAPAERPAAPQAVAVVPVPVASLERPSTVGELRKTTGALPPARAAAMPSVRPAPRAVALAVPAAPGPAPTAESHQPVEMAMAPTRTDQPGTTREVRALPVPHVEAPVIALGRAPEAPQPVRVATIDGPKATPAVEVSPRPEKRHRTWVSRPATDEREIYHSDDPGTRLADARDKLDRDVRRIVDDEVKGFVIH